jgi:hypothetical protein
MNGPHPGTSRTVCTCRQCRRDIRLAIEAAFVAEPRWMGEMTIRFRAHLGWVPLLLFRHILGRMVLLGILVKSHDPGDEFPRYLLARVTLPARALAKQGGGR